jgi:V/A-type H+-transporting ATPase subunit B
MPADDISHPVPDLTGYITEGQMGPHLFSGRLSTDCRPAEFVALDERRWQGTREDPALRQLSRATPTSSACGVWPTSSAKQARSARPAIPEVWRGFETRFLNHGEFENRSIATTLEIGWEMLTLLPRDELHRVSDDLLEEQHRATAGKQRVATAGGSG